ncbi:MAG: glycosyltransferase family 2 protein [Actinomycetota bacterium]
MPLLSVIVPTRDRVKRLPNAIDSLRHQTMRDLEVIVVDDGSTDGTEALLDELEASDGRIRTLRLAGGSGAAVARNAGLAAAVGPFIAFLDDDDTWMPTKAEEQINYLTDHADTGLVSCDFMVFDGKREVVHRGPHSFKPGTLLWANLLMGCSFVMLRRSAFTFEIEFDQAVVPAEDWDLWVRCANERKVATLPSVLCTYARHGAQLTGSSERIHRGDSGFLAKHGSRMSRYARAYHDAHLRMVKAVGILARLRTRISIVRDTPPAVVSLMGKLAVSGRVGELVGDPGRPFRTLARGADRLE